MVSTIKITCSRCSGSGKFSFNLIRGDVCFGCSGLGYTMTTQEKITAAKKAKIASDAKKAVKDALTAKLVFDYNVALYARIEKYKNDPRIGVKTQARCEEFPAVADQTYRTLELVDSGKYPYSIDDLSV